DPNSPLDPDSTRADMGALYFDQSSPQIALSADSLWFPDTYVGESSTKSFTIYNAGAGDLILNGMSNSLPGIFTYNWVPEDSLIAPGDSIVVRVAFSPSDSILYTDDLVIDNNDVQVSVYLEGQGLPVVGIKNGREDLPLEFALLPAHPNPFNPSTTISFQLPVAGFVKLEIFDVNGCRVGVGLEPTRWYPPGHHEITFDGSHLSAGIYFARLTVGDFQQTQKMVLIK
ncbi:MAG TPA: T9SS type A sorting domain-containing protein, partial [Bacteroidetes bacterium]|nr:T9SS type A sorting domain-containing protein [Bacteroidota bacterium]